jgi:phenylalanyl-tRNA synthetase alpha chain
MRDLVLELLDRHSEIANTDTLEVNQLELLGVLNALKSRDILDYSAIVTFKLQLTPEGQEIATMGSHEARVFHKVKESNGISIQKLMVP